MAKILNNSCVRVNDIFEELSEENKRLLNDLMFADNCLNIFIRFKTFFDLVFNKFKNNLDSNDSQKFEEFVKEIDEVLSRKTKVVESKDDHNSDTNSLNPNPVIKSKRRSNQTNGKKTFLCDVNYCEFKTHLKRNLMNHLNAHKDEIKPFKCHYFSCGKRFFAEESLECHIRKAHEFRDKCLEPNPNALNCEFPGCVKTFKENRYMRSHYQIVHLKQKKVKIRRLSCDEPGCQYRADCEYILNVHKASHSDERPFKCSFDGCLKSFKVKGNLKCHTEECHLGKRYKCTAIGCDMTFGNPKTLKHHFQTQHSDKVLTCVWPGCEYTTKVDRNLRNHKLVHKIADYVCDWPECNKRFKSRKYLKQHLRIHSNDKRYACSWPGCQYRCAYTSNIHKHKKIHEKNFL